MQMEIPEFQEFMNNEIKPDSKNLVFVVEQQVGSGKTIQICSESFELANKYASARLTADCAMGDITTSYIVRAIPFIRGNH